MLSDEDRARLEAMFAEMSGEMPEIERSDDEEEGEEDDEDSDEEDEEDFEENSAIQPLEIGVTVKFLSDKD